MRSNAHKVKKIDLLHLRKANSSNYYFTLPIYRNEVVYLLLSYTESLDFGEDILSPRRCALDLRRSSRAISYGRPPSRGIL